MKSDNRCEEDVLEMEKRWRALPKFVSIDFNDVDHTDDPSNDAAISDDDDDKRWRALLGLVTDD